MIKGESQAIRGLAKYTEEIRDTVYKLWLLVIILILLPGVCRMSRKTDLLYNVGFLCRRDGTYEMYEKMHVTPDEIKSWGLERGQAYYRHLIPIVRRLAF